NTPGLRSLKDAPRKWLIGAAASIVAMGGGGFGAGWYTKTPEKASVADSSSATQLDAELKKALADPARNPALKEQLAQADSFAAEIKKKDEDLAKAKKQLAERPLPRPAGFSKVSDLQNAYPWINVPKDVDLVWEGTLPPGESKVVLTRDANRTK